VVWKLGLERRAGCWQKVILYLRTHRNKGGIQICVLKKEGEGKRKKERSEYKIAAGPFWSKSDETGAF